MCINHLSRVVCDLLSLVGDVLAGHAITYHPNITFRIRTSSVILHLTKYQIDLRKERGRIPSTVTLAFLRKKPVYNRSTTTTANMNSGTGIQELMAAETRASQIVAEARIGQ